MREEIAEIIEATENGRTDAQMNCFGMGEWKLPKKNDGKSLAFFFFCKLHQLAIVLPKLKRV